MTALDMLWHCDEDLDSEFQMKILGCALASLQTLAEWYPAEISFVVLLSFFSSSLTFH